MGDHPAYNAFFWRIYAIVYDLIWDSPLTDTLAQISTSHLPSACTVVDLGCGTGLMTRQLSQHVIGVDASPAMLTRATRKQRIDRGVHAPVHETGLESGCASAVLTCNVLHLVPDPRGVINEALRLCSPAGTIFFCWPLDEPDTDTIFQLERRLGRSAPRAVLAHALRQLIGIAAALTRTPRRTSASIEQVLSRTQGLEVVFDTILHGCQRVMVLRPFTEHEAKDFFHSPSERSTE
ncbi:class I SAM-dependent methyltransferase [Arthrobacter sp. GN70]|nr:class I SAM-dependent methyltransferase [Arthrobacter sp. GN70]